MAFPWIGKSEDGNTITLRKLNEGMFPYAEYCNPDWIAANSDKYRVGAVVDVETTGLDHSKDKVIEIGLRLFAFNHLTGDILYLSSEHYSGLQDPGMPLSEEIKTLTCINDEMLKGQMIDWNKVNALVSRCHIIIAHNSSFDRPFIDQLSVESQNKMWGCSFKQIDWKSHGFPSQKLELLSVFHGFFIDAHRALTDSDALIYLLGLKNNKTQAPYLLELLRSAEKTQYLISAFGSAYAQKDLLKGQNYQWDGKVWSKEVEKEQYPADIKWLEDNIYHGPFRGQVREINAFSRFKKFT